MFLDGDSNCNILKLYSIIISIKFKLIYLQISNTFLHMPRKIWLVFGEELIVCQNELFQSRSN